MATDDSSTEPALKRQKLEPDEMDAMDSPSDSELHRAVARNSVPEVQQLLERLEAIPQQLRSLMTLQPAEFNNLTPVALAARQLEEAPAAKQEAAAQVLSLLLAAAGTADSLFLYLLLEATDQYDLCLLQWMVYRRHSAALQQVLQACADHGKLDDVLRTPDQRGNCALLDIKRIGHAETLALQQISGLERVSSAATS